ncbi:type II toxin-antitoxin system mRNA interferase toxin, RelE/StbE family [Scytonema sp. UIC 10036]|uniref:type II toxin-antitoxin system mRNA interferase toxin, RelE/StbE family n=1 Tax=Scytonema sp. UIC 10036 TaxID=2304196 RepID=UPI00137C5BD7|nr:type II toxin-antitoxin system mRNA interferase toxin, RelE/StbE family [Scytonema sp. UIC 10036]
MAYQIEFTPAANRQFKKLPKEVQQRIERKVNQLAIEPLPDGVKKLKGTDSLYRVPVGSYRIIYQILDAVLLVTVVRVAHRKEVYRSRFYIGGL